MDSTWEFPPSFQYGSIDQTLQALLEDWPSSGAEPMPTTSSFFDFHCHEQYPETPAECCRSDLITNAPNTGALVPPPQAASADPTQGADTNRCGPIHGNAILHLDPPGPSGPPTPVQRGKPNSSHYGVSTVSTSKPRLQCHWTGCAYKGTFGRKADLMRHIENTHVDPRAHQCPIEGCGKLFNRKDNLDHHLQHVHCQS